VVYKKPFLYHNALYLFQPFQQIFSSLYLSFA
jgi:hypothetical protein